MGNGMPKFETLDDVRVFLAQYREQVNSRLSAVEKELETMGSQIAELSSSLNGRMTDVHRMQEATLRHLTGRDEVGEETLSKKPRAKMTTPVSITLGGVGGVTLVEVVKLVLEMFST